MVKLLTGPLLCVFLSAALALGGEKAQGTVPAGAPSGEKVNPAKKDKDKDKDKGGDKGKDKDEDKDKDKEKTPEEKKKEEEKKRKALEAKLAKLIKELGHDTWDVREAAQKRLLEIGAPAIPQLQKAAKSKDLEVVTRAKVILKNLVGQGWLGVRIRDPQAGDIREGMPRDGGCVVSELLPDTPATKAKLVPGDVLYSLDGKLIKNSTGLVEIVAKTWPGTKSKLILYRGGKKQEVKVTIGRRPKEYLRPEQ
jgi:C-terminal processing protease CtpA/Prc